MVEIIKNKKNKIILFLVLIVLIIAIDIIFYSKFIYNDRSYHTEDHLEYNNKYEEDGNIVIEQTFISNGDNLQAVAIRI